ncbi:MAG: hypothetical protein OXE52_13005 [Chloroflexi bacterium]|nr:hypothetical protein [Chloroflexota bacterium]
MPKKYPREQRLEALGLLSMYSNNVQIVHDITGIHIRTLRRWRAQMERKKNRRETRKNRLTDTKQPNTAHFGHNADAKALPQSHHGHNADTKALPQSHHGHNADAKALPQSHHGHNADAKALPQPRHGHNADTKALPQPHHGHKDPIEDDPAPNDVFEDLNYIRDQLMQLTRQLSASLNPDDPDFSRQTLAIARLLDRILALDKLIPEKNPQETVRFEYYYDGAVQKLPPWYGVSTELGPVRSVENYLPESHPVHRPPSPIIAMDDHSAADEETT